jgi:hypothetical protein
MDMSVMRVRSGALFLVAALVSVSVGCGDNDRVGSDPTVPATSAPSFRRVESAHCYLIGIRT